MLQVRISYAQRNLQTALSEKNVAGFYAALWQFVGIIIVAAPSFALAGWLEVRVHGQLFSVDALTLLTLLGTPNMKR